MIGCVKFMILKNMRSILFLMVLFINCGNENELHFHNGIESSIYLYCQKRDSIFSLPLFDANLANTLRIYRLPSFGATGNINDRVLDVYFKNDTINVYAKKDTINFTLYSLDLTSKEISDTSFFITDGDATEFYRALQESQYLNLKTIVNLGLFDGTEHYIVRAKLRYYNTFYFYHEEKNKELPHFRFIEYIISLIDNKVGIKIGKSYKNIIDKKQ